MLRPACPVCGQTLRANDWIETVGEQPISIAHEIRFGRRTIERRALDIGEESSPDAYVVASLDARGKPKFAPARGREAPEGWREKLRYSFKRAAVALGFRVEEVDAGDPAEKLRGAESDIEFEREAAAYIREAQRDLDEARAELDVRRREVTQMTARRAR